MPPRLKCHSYGSRTSCSQGGTPGSDAFTTTNALLGPLRVSAPVTFGRMPLGPVLYSFLAQHPELELTLVLDDRRVDAAADSFDAEVRHGVMLTGSYATAGLAPSETTSMGWRC